MALVSQMRLVLQAGTLPVPPARQAYVSDALGAQLLRCVAETADLGRQVGAYGAKVPVADNASDFAKALGLAGRNPN